MEDNGSFLHRMVGHLCSTCKYYTRHPKDLGPSWVVHFTSERDFVEVLHKGRPGVVAFTIRGNLTKHLDNVLEEAAVEFYPNVTFVRFNYDLSADGFRNFFKHYKIHPSDTK